MTGFQVVLIRVAKGWLKLRHRIPSLDLPRLLQTVQLKPIFPEY